MNNNYEDKKCILYFAIYIYIELSLSLFRTLGERRWLGLF